MKERRVNISEILDYFRCPAYWAQRWYMGKKLVGKREHAADVGKVLHAVWEDAMKTYQNVQGSNAVGTTLMLLGQQEDYWEKSMHHRMRQEWLKAGFDEDKNDLRKLTALSHRAAWWWGQPLPFDRVLAVEEMLETRIGEVTVGDRGDPIEVVLFGKPDALCERDGIVKHHQLKSYGGNHPGLKVKLIKRSLHEAGYYILALNAFPLESHQTYKGTHLTMLQSLPLKQKTSEGLVMRPHASMCIDMDLFITEPLRKRALMEILRAVKEMLTWEARLDANLCTPQELPQYEHHCGGAFSNSECWFLETCMGYADLNDRMLYEDGNPLEHYEVKA